jgi:hypothetical protein
VYEIALEMFAFNDSRLPASKAAWNGALPAYQPLVPLVSIPSNALAQSETQPKTIA